MKKAIGNNPLVWELKTNGNSCELIVRDNITKNDDVSDESKSYTWDEYKMPVIYRKDLPGIIEESFNDWKECTIKYDIERTANEVRTKRDELLTDCDWTVLQDAQTDKSVWEEYRQALRDVTNQDGFPLDIIWPEKPSELLKINTISLDMMVKDLTARISTLEAKLLSVSDKDTETTPDNTEEKQDDVTEIADDVVDTTTEDTTPEDVTESDDETSTTDTEEETVEETEEPTVDDVTEQSDDTVEEAPSVESGDEDVINDTTSDETTEETPVKTEDSTDDTEEPTVDDITEQSDDTVVEAPSVESGDEDVIKDDSTKDTVTE